ncbi:MAG: two-component system, OmpR family, sensor histidine kinase KdpD [Actinomycetota bacterium]|nr:two-component system, OmpR family, sensor histidine kinase KdpD [Actinomycetota bacterium]
MSAGFGKRLADDLSAPELSSSHYDRMLAVAQALQVAVGAVALVAIWVFPGADQRDRITVTALLLGVYLPWTLISRQTAVLSTGPVARVLNLAFDLAAIGCFALVIPYTRTAVMFAYALVIVFHAYVSGRTAGLTMGAACLALTLAAELRVPQADRHDAFTLVMYAVVIVSLAVMVDALAAERRRTSRHLNRLHIALDALGPDLSLPATVESIAAAAQHAVGAAFVAVLLPELDQLGAVATAGIEYPPGDDRGAEKLREAMSIPEESPSAVALATGAIVAVADVVTDARFSRWTATAEQYGFRSMVVVPLGSKTSPIGVLNAYFAEVEGFDEADVDLLQAYARHAYLAVARALAFETERRAGIELARADQLKSDFVATVSHELRTPLTSICGFVDTVLRQWDRIEDDAKRDLLGRASWNASELRRLIEQILVFSASESAGTTADLEPYALAAGVDEVVSNMAPALEDRVVRVEIPADLMVMANDAAIHHVIGNLVGNAAKFSPPDTAVAVTARAVGGVARVMVVDHGPGIPDDETELVFGRFYRGTTTRGTRGTGIGLTIVRNTVERLGGSIAVSPTPGGGCTFEFTLPLAGAFVNAKAEIPG